MRILFLKTLKKQRCVFNSTQEDKPPDNIEEAKNANQIEEISNPTIIDSVEEKKEESKPEPKIKIEKNNTIQITPKKEEVDDKIDDKTNRIEISKRGKALGYKLFTITANVKIADKRYNITRIIEEKNEKKARIIFEKTIKSELGKAKSITKYNILDYKVGDENVTDEIKEEVKKQTEKSLFEKAFDILATSPYIHIYKIPNEMSNNSYHYAVYGNDTDMKRELVDKWQDFKNDKESEIQGKINISAVGTKMEKMLGRHMEKMDSVIYKILNKTRRLTPAEVRNSKDVRKYVGSQDDEWYEAIIKIHESETYEHEHKEEIIVKNIQMIFDENRDDIQVFFGRINGIVGSEGIVVARNEDQAHNVFMASEHIINVLKELKEINKKENPDSSSFNIDLNLGKVKEDQKDCIYDKEFMELFLQNETLGLQMLSDSELTIDKIDKVLAKIDRIENMSEEEKNNAVTNLINSPFMNDKMANDITAMTGMLPHKLLEKLERKEYGTRPINLAD